jgi:hypothetical protein
MTRKHFIEFDWLAGRDLGEAKDEAQSQKGTRPRQAFGLK